MPRNKHENDFFANLLYEIYGRINLKIDNIFLKDSDSSKKEVIMFCGGEYSKNTYTHKKLENYDYLFYLTFCAPEIYFVNEKGNVIFKRANAVSNAIDYFRKFEVEIPEYFRTKSENKILCKALYTAFIDILLPVIFECQNIKKKLDKKLEMVKARLQSHFAGIELGYLEGINATAKDYKIIYDSEYFDSDSVEKFDDFYAITVDTAQFAVRIYIPCLITAVSLGVKNSDDNDRYSLKRIIGNYQKYPFEDDEPFLDPFAGQAEGYIANNPRYTEESCFPLSDVVIPAQYFIPRYFYYITRINQDIIDRYNEDIKKNIRAAMSLTNERGEVIMPREESVEEKFELEKLDHDKLNTLLMERAAKDFREAHRDDISEYYRHVMTYIEDMIRRIATADYSCAIRRDSDVEACQKFAKHFNIDYEKIIEFIEDDYCVEKCYELIEEAVFEFANRIEIDSYKLANEFAKFLPSDIELHYNSIGEYIESGKLTNAIRLKAEILSENPDTDLKIEMPMIEENQHLNYDETFRIAGAYEKTGNIYMKIYNNLKQYYESLGRAIKDE